MYVCMFVSMYVCVNAIKQNNYNSYDKLQYRCNNIELASILYNKDKQAVPSLIESINLTSYNYAVLWRSIPPFQSSSLEFAGLINRNQEGTCSPVLANTVQLLTQCLPRPPHSCTVTNLPLIPVIFPILMLFTNILSSESDYSSYTCTIC